MYVIVWEFHASEGKEKEFERVYGSGGAWADFFKRGKGYVRTELLRERETSAP